MLKTSVIIEDLDNPQVFELTLKQIKSAGFDAVDPALFTPKIIEIIESSGGLEYAAELRRMIDESGLFIGQCHTALCSSPDQWDRTIEITCKTLPFATEMGARYPVVHPICPLTIHDPLIRADKSELFKLNRRMFGRLVPIADEYG